MANPANGGARRLGQDVTGEFGPPFPLRMAVSVSRSSSDRAGRPVSRGTVSGDLGGVAVGSGAAVVLVQADERVREPVIRFPFRR